MVLADMNDLKICDDFNATLSFPVVIDGHLGMLSGTTTLIDIN